MEKNGKHLVMESHGKWAKKIKSWTFKKSTAYIEARMRNSDNSISTAVFWLWQTFSLCSKFQIVMLGKSKLLIFSFDID